ncbi:hypothetical protein [Streptomyces sp. NPDC005548]|uniref:hypothetical protein n=1 Tax=Streptomyces sp. NPDC005548 TaxID=3364724 RepID=UPI00367CA014
MGLIVLAVVALAAAAVALWQLVRRRRLCRVLAQERATNVVIRDCLHQDLNVFRARVLGMRAELPVVAEQRVLAEAGLVVDAALSAWVSESSDPRSEGGPV